jgi:hypothetical protein
VELLTLLLRLPFLPVTGLVRLAEIIRDQAEAEYYSPSAARHELEEAEAKRASGELSDQQVEQQEEQALGRLVQPAPAGAGEGEAGPER